jgi:hypothetical protein
MPEPIAIALIALVSAVIGGLLRPWGQDWVNRNGEARAEKLAGEAERKARIERVSQILRSATAFGPSTHTEELAWGELQTAASAVSDPALSNAVETLLAVNRSDPAWSSALLEAKKRVGQLLSVR